MIAGEEDRFENKFALTGYVAGLPGVSDCLNKYGIYHTVISVHSRNLDLPSANLLPYWVSYINLRLALDSPWPQDLAEAFLLSLWAERLC